MIWFLVSTSFFDPSDVRRKSQQIDGIRSLHASIAEHKISNYRIIILENNGSRKTFLDDIGEVFYTSNNSIQTPNKGIKELRDVLDCIQSQNIPDDDFIIKLTGRQKIDFKSQFMSSLNDIDSFDAILRYGAYFQKAQAPEKNCVTGLIGMRCKFVKKIEMPDDRTCVEIKWATVTFDMEPSRVRRCDNLGVWIAPLSNNFFKV